MYKPTSASAVSNYLRRNGFNPVAPESYGREGVKVRRAMQTGRCHVTVDIDSPSAARRMFEGLTEVLDDSPFEYVSRSSDDGDFLSVTVTGRK